MVKNICFNNKVNFVYSVDFSSGFLGHLYLIKSYPIHNVVGYVLKYSSNKLIVFESSFRFFAYTMFVIIKHNIFKSVKYNNSYYFLYNFLSYYSNKNGLCLHFSQNYDQIEWRKLRYFFGFFHFKPILLHNRFTSIDFIPVYKDYNLKDILRGFSLLLEPKYNRIRYDIFFSFVKLFLLYFSDIWDTNYMSNSDLELFNFNDDKIDYSNYIFFSDFSLDITLMLSGIFLDCTFLTFDLYYHFYHFNVITHYSQYFTLQRVILKLFLHINFTIYYYLYLIHVLLFIYHISFLIHLNIITL